MQASDAAPANPCRRCCLLCDGWIDVTTSSFVTGALRELSVALVKGDEVVSREDLHVYATAGGSAARVGAMVPIVDPE
jgi:hypothetical protein